MLLFLLTVPILEFCNVALVSFEVSIALLAYGNSLAVIPQHRAVLLLLLLIKLSHGFLMFLDPLPDWLIIILVDFWGVLGVTIPADESWGYQDHSLFELHNVQFVFH